MCSSQSPNWRLCLVQLTTTHNPIGMCSSQLSVFKRTLEFRVEGSGFRVEGLRFRVEGLGFRVEG